VGGGGGKKEEKRGREEFPGRPHEIFHTSFALDDAASFVSARGRLGGRKKRERKRERVGVSGTAMATLAPLRQAKWTRNSSGESKGKEKEGGRRGTTTITIYLYLISYRQREEKEKRKKGKGMLLAKIPEHFLWCRALDLPRRYARQYDDDVGENRGWEGKKKKKKEKSASTGESTLSAISATSSF